MVKIINGIIVNDNDVEAQSSAQSAPSSSSSSPSTQNPSSSNRSNSNSRFNSIFSLPSNSASPTEPNGNRFANIRCKFYFFIWLLPNLALARVLFPLLASRRRRKNKAQPINRTKSIHFSTASPRIFSTASKAQAAQNMGPILFIAVTFFLSLFFGWKGLLISIVGALGFYLYYRRQGGTGNPLFPSFTSTRTVVQNPGASSSLPPPSSSSATSYVSSWNSGSQQQQQIQPNQQQQQQQQPQQPQQQSRPTPGQSRIRTFNDFPSSNQW